jgi:hypothetical protein
MGSGELRIDTITIPFMAIDPNQLAQFDPATRSGVVFLDSACNGFEGSPSLPFYTRRTTATDDGSFTWVQVGPLEGSLMYSRANITFLGGWSPSGTALSGAGWVYAQKSVHLAGAVSFQAGPGDPHPIRTPLLVLHREAVRATCSGQTAAAGTTELELASNDGWAPGDYAQMTVGEQTVVRRVAALGSLIFDAPLPLDIPAGSTVANIGAPNGDRTPPTISGPDPIQQVALGSVAAPLDVVCDDGSGVGVETCDVPSRLDTSALGVHQFNVASWDWNGNYAGQSISYEVVEELPPSGLQPDGLIMALRDGVWVGDDLFGLDGSGQSVEAWRKPRHRAVFIVEIQNQGEFADRFRLTGLGSEWPFTVRYYHRGWHVGKAIADGGLVTRVLDPGEVYRLKVRVKVRRAAAEGAVVERLIQIASLGDPSVFDAVRFVVARRS